MSLPSRYLILRQRLTGYYYKGFAADGRLLLCDGRRAAYPFKDQDEAGATLNRLSSWAVQPFEIETVRA